MGYNITPNYPALPVQVKTIVNTINPHSYCVAKRDPRFKLALEESDILLPDGIGIVLAAKFLNGKKITRIAGYDIFLYLMHYLNESQGSCFFFGASENTLRLIKQRAHKEYPQVTVHCYSPPYRDAFTDADSKVMRSKVNTCHPEILFVGMTAPKQEKWVHQNKEELTVKIICSIGAVFDFYAGTVKRAPQWMMYLGLEWFHRAISNPRRLGMRYLKANPEFLWDLFTYRLRLNIK